MGDDLAEAILRALRPAGAREPRDRGIQLLQEALALYSPSNLVELYMAVRAKVAGRADGFQPLIEALRRAADREPHLLLADLAARASA